MILSWRRSRKSGRISTKKSDIGIEPEMNFITPPAHFRCPISLELMKDPVTISTGITYDRESIEKWLDAGNKTCPVTNQTLTNFEQIPNHAIRKMIQFWCVENKSQGIERIPTPRIPVTRYDVSDICSKISLAAARSSDHNKCREFIEKAKMWMKESEKNRKCLVEGGTGDVLATAFEFFASIKKEFEFEYDDILSTILSVLPQLLPFSEESRKKLCSAPSIRCMARFLNKEDPNSVLLLKELTIISSNSRNVINKLLSIEEIEESLMKIAKLQLSPRATKAALTLIYHTMTSSPSNSASTHFANSCFISFLLNLTVDSERSLCEKSVAVLDAICAFEDGRKKVTEHALSIPVMVKKLLRVSGTATELSVSVIWRLCKNEEGCCVEAIRLGCFQKLLVVLQVGCGGKTKEKVSEVLKMMNQYRGKYLECFDSSMNLKHINRPSF